MRLCKRGEPKSNCDVDKPNGRSMIYLVRDIANGSQLSVGDHTVQITETARTTAKLTFIIGLQRSNLSRQAVIMS